MGNLNENSKSYYQSNNFYEIFSLAEDFPGLVDFKLKEYTKNKTVLDAGCGTGKYSKSIISVSESYLGIDKSANQIDIARKKSDKEYFKVADLLEFDSKGKKFEIIISCWCLGTIEINKRMEVLKNLKSICTDSIILVENLENSEFEQIRYGNNNTKTIEYLSFLKNNNFKLVDEIDTYFQFSSLEAAKNVFRNIYNKNIANNIKSNKIKHRIGIFRLDVNK